MEDNNTTESKNLFASGYSAISRVAADTLASWPPAELSVDTDPDQLDAACKIACARGVGILCGGLGTHDRPDGEALALEIVRQGLREAIPFLAPEAVALVRETERLADELEQLGVGPYAEQSDVGRLVTADAALLAVQKAAERDLGFTFGNWVVVRATRTLRERCSRSLVLLADADVFKPKGSA